MLILKRFLFLVGIALFGCEAENLVDPPAPPDTSTLATRQFTTGSTNNGWVYFSFAKADTVPASVAVSAQEWDLAFFRTTIKINGGTSGPGKGGVTMLTGVNLEDIKEAPASTVFAVDDTLGNGYAIPTGSGGGWYHYTADPNHWILARDDRVFIFRTADEKYAKMKILSYYSNGQPPSLPLQLDSGYYTFKFVYQGNGSTSFE